MDEILRKLEKERIAANERAILGGSFPVVNKFMEKEREDKKLSKKQFKKLMKDLKKSVFKGRAAIQLARLRDNLERAQDYYDKLNNSKTLDEFKSNVEEIIKKEFEINGLKEDKINFPEFIIQTSYQNLPEKVTKEEIKECILKLFRDEIENTKEGENYKKEIDVEGKKFTVHLEPKNINLQMKALLNIYSCYTPLSGFSQAFIAIQYLCNPQIFFGVVTNKFESPIGRVTIVNANEVVKLNKVFFNYNIADPYQNLFIKQQINQGINEALSEFSEINKKNFRKNGETIITISKGVNSNFPYLKVIDGKTISYSLYERENKLSFIYDFSSSFAFVDE
jgi:hypothetical protein